MKEQFFEPQISPCGDNALIITFGENINIKTQEKIMVFSDYLEKSPLPGMIEYIPSFTKITILYDPFSIYQQYPEKNRQSPYQIFSELVYSSFYKIKEHPDLSRKTVTIPVCYDKRLGPDLEYVAKYNNLSIHEVIKLHSQKEYLVYMLGFAPGFPYLGGMDNRIAAPRKKTPQLKIPAGSVGIAGEQTGIYPIETPGGWQIIGRTPLNLFEPLKQPPTLLKAGNLINFKPISYSEYCDLTAARSEAK